MHPIWNMVHTERAGLMEDLKHVSDDDWKMDSLCSGWTVHDVAAHLVDCALTTSGNFAVTMMRAGFDFNRQNARGVAANRGATPAETLTRLSEVVHRSSGPPRILAPLASRLVEEIAHGEDIRRPLGITRNYPSDAVAKAIRYQVWTGVKFGGAKELVNSVQLVSDNSDLEIGDGPAITGPALELLMLVSGRSPRQGSLSGPGMEDIEVPGNDKAF